MADGRCGGVILPPPPLWSVDKSRCARRPLRPGEALPPAPCDGGCHPAGRRHRLPNDRHPGPGVTSAALPRPAPPSPANASRCSGTRSDAFPRLLPQRCQGPRRVTGVLDHRTLPPSLTEVLSAGWIPCRLRSSESLFPLFAHEIKAGARYTSGNPPKKLSALGTKTHTWWRGGESTSGTPFNEVLYKML